MYDSLCQPGPRGPRWLRYLCLGMLLLVLAGCQREEIERYQVTRLPEPEAPRGPFDYKMPPGWRIGPPAALSQLTLETGEGLQLARMTVTPLAGAAGGLASNINRWRVQVGLPEVSEEQLLKQVQPIQIGGRPSSYIEIVGAEKAILGAILPGNRETLFFKFMGPLAVVSDNKANFKQFLDSIKFDAGEGANDGK